MASSLCPRLLVAAIVITANGAPPLAAQGARAFMPSLRNSPPDSGARAGNSGQPGFRAVRDDSTRAPNKRPPRLELSAVVVSGKPGALEVVAIPLPRDISKIDAVHFVVSPAPGVRLIGRTEGVLTEPTNRPASLVVTVIAPKSALAGRSRVASVFFDALGGETALEVPVEMNVQGIHHVELTIVDQLVGARRGDVVTIRYRAVNFGNVPDSVSLGAQVPEGWKVADGISRMIRLGVHGAVDGAVRIWIPSQAAPGTQLVHLVATSGGAVVSAGDVRVEVENPYVTASQDGPRLDFGSVVSSLQQGPTSLAYVGSLQGKIADSVSVSANGVWRNENGSPSPITDLALLRLGIPTVPPSFALTSPTFRFGAGLTGGTLSELTGNYVNGNGVSAGVTVDGWSVSGTSARPYQYGAAPVPGSSTPGDIGEARIDRRLDSGSVFIMATHLVDPAATRQLDAASVGAAFSGTPFGQLSSEVGYRRYADGEGLGFSSDLEKQTDDGAFSLRVLHAPGGARAFARATDEIASSGNQRVLDWLGFAGGVWHTDDGSSTFGASSGSGWNAGPTFLSRDLGASLSVQARSSTLNVTGSTGGFGDSENGIMTDAEIHRGIAFATSTVTVGTISRSVATGDGTSLSEDGTNLDARFALGASGNSGSVQVNAGLQEYNGTAGLMPGQWMIGVRAERVAIPIADRWRMYAGGEVQRLGFSVGGNPGLSQRYTLTIPVGRWFDLSAVAERNPFYTIGSNGRLGWLTAVRVDRSVILPRLVSPGEAHVVYRDLNGNGRRDDGEPGVAGIVVNCGDRTVVTDSRGRFKCGSAETFSIDARSIPVGLLAPDVDGVPRHPSDVGLTTMTAVHVSIDVSGVDTVRMPRTDLLKLIVIARDTANQPWVARGLSAGELVFDALPPGDYAIDVDASAIDEPLTMGDRVTFRVDGAASPTIRVSLHGRTMKVRVLPPTQSDGPLPDKNAPRTADRQATTRQSSKERD